VPPNENTSAARQLTAEEAMADGAGWCGVVGGDGCPLLWSSYGVRRWCSAQAGGCEGGAAGRRATAETPCDTACLLCGARRPRLTTTIAPRGAACSSRAGSSREMIRSMKSPQRSFGGRRRVPLSSVCTVEKPKSPVPTTSEREHLQRGPPRLLLLRPSPPSQMRLKSLSPGTSSRANLRHESSSGQG
jgi:hypothetical protein